MNPIIIFKNHPVRPFRSNGTSPSGAASRGAPTFRSGAASPSGAASCSAILGVLAVFLLLFPLATPLSATPERDLFAKANDALAHRDAKTALDLYLKIADSSGTGPALADNIAAAADLAGEPGIAEWARRTALLRRTEWWLILSGASAVFWAAAVAFGIWRRWTWKKHTAAALLGVAGIAAGLYCAHRWMPPAGEAVVIRATPKSDGSIPAADILLSPFAGAEVVGSLQPGTHVMLLAPPENSTTSTQAPEGFLRIHDPQSGLTGWVRKDEVRETGK